MIGQTLDPANTVHITGAAGIWTAACGPDLKISERFVRYNLQPAAGMAQAGQVAIQDGRPAGFVLASAYLTNVQEGWIDAIAVLPQFQRRGVGSALLDWAEDWLSIQGCEYAQLGGGLHPFVPGFPVELGPGTFFHNRGYAQREPVARVWDVAARLSEYTSPSTVRPFHGRVGPAQPGEEYDLLSFLRQEFPDRWQLEFEEALREGRRISDYVLLWTDRGVDAFCHVTFEDSLNPLDRVYPYRLPRPWGHLGPIGVSADCRGKGYGAVVLDAGLRWLRQNGVDGCVIDWTTLLNFYGKFGFTPYREYAMLIKEFRSSD